jgi:hypothetical protein
MEEVERVEPLDGLLGREGLPLFVDEVSILALRGGAAPGGK